MSRVWNFSVKVDGQTVGDGCALNLWDAISHANEITAHTAHSSKVEVEIRIQRKDGGAR